MYPTKLLFCLQMALEDSEQKQNLLHGISMELEELSPVFETDSVMQRLNEIDVQVAALQHEIAEILPQILHVADVSLSDPKVPFIRPSSGVRKCRLYLLHGKQGCSAGFCRCALKGNELFGNKPSEGVW